MDAKQVAIVEEKFETLLKQSGNAELIDAYADLKIEMNKVLAKAIEVMSIRDINKTSRL